MKKRSTLPAIPRWSKESDLNSVWSALNNIKFFGKIKGQSVLNSNGINITLSVNSTYARLTSDNTDGTYDASEVEYNNGSWTVKTNGITWGSTTSDKGLLYNANIVQGIPADTIVEVLRIYDNNASIETNVDFFFLPFETGIADLGGATASAGVATADDVSVSLGLGKGLYFNDQDIDVGNLKDDVSFPAECLSHVNVYYDTSTTPATFTWQLDATASSYVPAGTTTNDMLYWDNTEEEWTVLSAPASTGTVILGVIDGTLQWLGTCEPVDEVDGGGA